jgi:peptidoglycan/LPS O-acetylase OafA/YrhL
VTARQGVARAVLSGPVLVYVGQRSYALYLWHYAFATWFNNLDVLGYALTVGASFAAAEVSWRLVESPALALKARLEPRADRAANRADSEVPDLGSGPVRPIWWPWARKDGGGGVVSPRSAPGLASLAWRRSAA